MYSRLFIAEKPSVGQEIAGALGGRIVRRDGFLEVGDDAVTWCVGHLLEQSPPDAYGSQFTNWSLDTLPILPNAGQWKMQPSKRTAAQLAIIGGLLKKTKCVVNGGDSAREGQLIVDEVLIHFGYTGPAKRLWLREMGRAAIVKAIGTMKDNRDYLSVLESALSRQRADWLIGMNMTRAYTCAARNVGGKGVLHVGRVQTPTLAIIVNRDLEIENFKPQDFYVLKGLVGVAAGSFEATWQAPKDAACLDAEGRVKDKKVLDAIAAKVKGKPARVVACEVTPRKEAQPLPFSLGDLQKEASKILGLSPSETLATAQTLYEKHKLISYPRTDYSHLPESEHSIAGTFIDAAKKTFGAEWDFAGTPDLSIRSHAWNNAKIGDHHGLRPTATVGNFAALSKTEKIIYRLVVRNFLAQFFPHRQVESTKISVECEGENFLSTGLVEIAPGWRLVVPPSKKEDPPLPPVNKGDKGSMKEATVSSEKTRPPNRFDGGLLIDAMERAHLFVTDAKIKSLLKGTGIGTPATRASIVDSLLSRGYVEERKEGRKKAYISTTRGRALIEIVDDYLRKPDITAFCESLLEQVASTEMDMDDFLVRQARLVATLTDRVRAAKISPAAAATLSEESKFTGGNKGAKTASKRPGSPKRAAATTKSAPTRRPAAGAFTDLPI